MKEAMAALTREIKNLQAIKKRKSDEVNDARIALRDRKAEEKETKKTVNGTSREIIRKIEDIFQKYYITKPYYHGGKYNGKGMCTFMTESQEIMADIQDMILTIPQEDRCSNEEVAEYTSRFKHCLQVFDYIFSKARLPSGSVTPQDVENLRPFVVTALKLYRELGLSISPKPHAVEDHLCEQLIRLKGIGDLGEDFVEKSHQDGIRKESKSKNCVTRESAAKQHCRWEHKENLPTVLDKKNTVQRCSIRTKRARDHDGNMISLPTSKAQQKKQCIAEEKLTLRTNALAETRNTNEQYLKSGRQLNIEETKKKVENAERVLNRQVTSYAELQILP